MLPLSLALYFATLSMPLPVPTWPVEGQWFFNPLAWQLMFVLGFVMAREDGVGGFVRRHIVPLRWLALPIVAVSAYVVWNGLWPDPTLMPQPVLLFIADKTYVTPDAGDPVSGAGRFVFGRLIPISSAGRRGWSSSARCSGATR